MITIECSLLNEKLEILQRLILPMKNTYQTKLLGLMSVIEFHNQVRKNSEKLETLDLFKDLQKKKDDLFNIYKEKENIIIKEFIQSIEEYTKTLTKAEILNYELTILNEQNNQTNEQNSSLGEKIARIFTSKLIKAGMYDKEAENIQLKACWHKGFSDLIRNIKLEERISNKNENLNENCMAKQNIIKKFMNSISLQDYRKSYEEFLLFQSLLIELKSIILEDYSLEKIKRILENSTLEEKDKLRILDEFLNILNKDNLQFNIKNENIESIKEKTKITKYIFFILLIFLTFSLYKYHTNKNNDTNKDNISKLELNLLKENSLL